jgi:iron complex outermembrane receptor protein
MKRVILAGALLLGSSAYAQDVALPEPVQQPAAGGKENEPEIALDADREIDLANVVTSAAKGVTTVQEAPAIITIITSDDIKARGFKFIDEALATIPGWTTVYAIGNQVELPMVRGVVQSALLLRDGVSLFDPWGNINTFNRTQPVENIKRLEVVTGPGGVLWGANSFLGIVNVITKDAEDVNGLEFNAGYGDGPGNRSDFKAYGLFGKSFLKGKLKIFAHASFETWIGDTYNIPQYIAASPAPQPPGPAFYGTLNDAPPDRSWLFTIDGKITYDKVSLYWQVPVGDVFHQVGFANVVVPKDRINHYDRYGILEYKDRYLKDKLGLAVKGYYTQFVRDYDIQLFAPSVLFPPNNIGNPSQPATNVGGLHFAFIGQIIQRFGGTVDLDVNLPHAIRLLFGGEAFYEGINNSVAAFRENDPNNLPFYCPQRQNPDGTFTAVPTCARQVLNDASRTVAAAYLDAQWKPFSKLTLDGGARYQQGFGALPYTSTFLGSAAIVYNFLPDFHLKANYATGFRPPVFQNTLAALGGLEYGGNPNLKTETSQSFQGEINARLLRNVRKIRELELRVDYSYTFLDRFIQIHQGSYGNTGKRSIHSVEGYAKMYLNGDHFLQASYTYLYAQTSDSGVIRALPNHQVSLGVSFNIIKSTLDLNANLLVTGAYQDPNRYPSGLAPIGPCPANVPCYGAPTTVARTTDLTFDRLTPVALLQLGFRLRFLKERLGITGQFYNVLNQRYWVSDPFYDLTPSIEMTPTPAPGYNFFASASYHL